MTKFTFQLSDDNDVVALDELLESLARLNPRQAKIVEYRFFGGMTMREISTEMNLGLRTVEKEWAMSRAWMRRELRREEESFEKNDERFQAMLPLQNDLPANDLPGNARSKDA